MKSEDSGAPAKVAAVSPSLSATPDDRRSAVAVFEMWQHQWPALFRGEAWLHMERLKRAIADPHEGRERKAG